MNVPFANRALVGTLSPLALKEPVNLKLIIDDLQAQEETIPVKNDLANLQIVGPGKILFHFNSPGAAEDWKANGITFRGHPVILDATSSRQWVSLSRVPYGTPPEAITKALSQYGKVLNSRTETYKGVGISSRSVQMEITKPIPSRIMVGGKPINVFYRGQVRSCFKCGQVGHEVKMCPKRAQTSQSGNTPEQLPATGPNRGSYASVAAGKSPNRTTLVGENLLEGLPKTNMRPSISGLNSEILEEQPLPSFSLPQRSGGVECATTVARSLPPGEGDMNMDTSSSVSHEFSTNENANRFPEGESGAQSTMGNVATESHINDANIDLSESRDSGGQPNNVDLSESRDSEGLNVDLSESRDSEEQSNNVDLSESRGSEGLNVDLSESRDPEEQSSNVDLSECRDSGGLNIDLSESRDSEVQSQLKIDDPPSSEEESGSDTEAPPATTSLIGRFLHKVSPPRLRKTSPRKKSVTSKRDSLRPQNAFTRKRTQPSPVFAPKKRHYLTRSGQLEGYSPLPPGPNRNPSLPPSQD